MRKIEMNHWFIDENSLSISLMHFWVKIIMYKKDNNEICFVTHVIDNQDNLFMYFDTLEEAMMFTEKVINDCISIDQVTEKYKNYCNKNNKILMLTR